MKQSFKWYFLIISGLICAASLLWGILPAVNYLFLSMKNPEILRKALIKPEFIPEDSSIQDAITDDVFITAWDLNNRSPRFFSKWSQQNLLEDNFDHNMSLANMTWVSANTPYYFRPAVIDGNVYISGDNVAMSPAMFAFYYANEKKGIATDRIRVVSIGATNELADKIDTKASLLEWAVRLSSLNAPVKKHTQDYMLEYLLRKNGHELYKFEIDSTRKWEEDFYYTQTRLPILEDMSQQMVFSLRNEVQELLNTMIEEKFGPNACTSSS